MKAFSRVIYSLLSVFAAFLLFSVPSASGATKVKPQWVQKGEEFMNKKRTNQTYVFKVFHSSDPDLNRAIEKQMDPLLDYVRDTWKADPETFVLDSLVAEDGVPPTLRVSFRDSSGQRGAILARRADMWLNFEDFASNEYEFEFYQLFAVSANRDGIVEFDDFQPTTVGKTPSVLFGLIPGAGQIYKGDVRKGLILIGGELAFGAAALVFQQQMNKNQHHVDAGDFPLESWESKVAGFKLVRNISFGAMAGIWLFCIFDAYAAESLPRVLVKDADKQLSITPSGNGLSLVYNF